MADNTNNTDDITVPAGVSANAAHVEFPRDVWGFTTELRKAGLQAAGRVRGDQSKQELLLQTLSIIAQHALARFPEDQAGNAARAETLSTVGRLTVPGVTQED